MTWLLRHNWLWALLAFLLGALVTWLLLVRRVDTATEAEPVRRPADDHDLVPATTTGTASDATTTPEPSLAAAKPIDESDSKVTTVEPVVVAKPTGDKPNDDKAAEPVPAAKAPDATDPAQPAAATPTDPKSKEPKDSKTAASAGVTGAELDEDTAAPDDSAESSPTADQTEPDLPAGTPDDTRTPEPDDSAESSRPADTAAADENADQSAPYGEGSAAALPDGSAPEGFTIKGNADSMLYHTTDSPSYGRTKAEAWFRTEAAAEQAGFTRWDRRDRGGTNDKASGAAPAVSTTEPGEPSPTTASANVTGAELDNDVAPPDDSAESSPITEPAEGNVPANTSDDARTTDPDDSAESSDSARAGTDTPTDESSTPESSAANSSGSDETLAAGGLAVGEQSAPYGEGSAAALPDGSAPEGFTIKGNADSMLYHTTDSPSYGRTKAEAWFRTEADAKKAGFTRWDRN